MTVMPVMPRESREWTVDDLDHLPDDGLQYELLDGVLLVSPAPRFIHQVAALGLFRLLDPVTPDGMVLLVAPFDFQPDPRTSLQPDVLAFHENDVNEKNVTAPLVLAVEILSPSTRRKDLVFKRSKYEDAGVEHFWILDPDEPSITVLELAGGHYVERGRAEGEEALVLSAPFSVTLVPRQLVTVRSARSGGA